MYQDSVIILFTMTKKGENKQLTECSLTKDCLNKKYYVQNRKLSFEF